MKKNFLIMLFVMMSVMAFSQHQYIVKISNINSKAGVDSCLNIFAELGVKDYVYNEASKDFQIYTKNYLDKVIAYDYFMCYHYKIENMFEVGKKPELIKMPVNKE